MNSSLVVTLASVICLSIWSGYEVESRFNYVAAKYAKQYSGQIYHHNLVFEGKTKDVLKCLGLCAEHKKCAGFTFTPGVREVGNCRGHMIEDDDEGGGGENGEQWTASPSTMAYLLSTRFEDSPSQLHKACQAQSECAAPEAEARWTCLNGECLCALGYQYSIGYKDCVLG